MRPTTASTGTARWAMPMPGTPGDGGLTWSASGADGRAGCGRRSHGKLRFTETAGVNDVRRTVAIGMREIGEDQPPLVIAEAGINHEGDVGKALAIVDAAAAAEAECVKFQCHITEDEMIP